MKTNHRTQDYTQWNLPEGASARFSKEGIITDIQFSPDGNRLAVANTISEHNENQRIFITGIWMYDAHNGAELDFLRIPTDSVQQDTTPIPNHHVLQIRINAQTVQSVAFSADGYTLAGGGYMGHHSYKTTIHLWDVATGKYLRTFTGWKGDASSVVFSPDSVALASGDLDNIICLWDVATGKLRKTLTGHTSSVNSVCFSPDGHSLASASADNTIRLWDVATGKLRKTLTGHTSSVNSVCFSPDGRSLASGSGESEFISIFGSDETSDDTVRLWDVSTGVMKQTFREHTKRVNSVTFSPNGLVLASSSNDNTIRLWDVATGELQKTLTGHTNDVQKVIFNPDGDTLASSSSHAVFLWNVVIRNKSTLAEEKSGSQDHSSQIRQICTERCITTLVHFTRIENLQNILHKGLLDHQSLLKKYGQQFVPNDKRRIDGHKDAICLSISFPNYPLFSKFSWPEDDSQPDYSGWIVLLLDSKVLWELDCAFCQENAASNAVRYIPLEDRKKPDALKGMFVDVCRDTKGNVYQRQSLQMPDDYPTHPQAEVLVFDQIQSDYIKEVHFYDESTLKQWRDDNPWINPERLLHNQQYFQYGRDQVVWQNDNLDEDDIPF